MTSVEIARTMIEPRLDGPARPLRAAKPAPKGGKAKRASRLPPGVIDINGQRFAIGLFWQTASSASSAKAEAKRTAKSAGTKGNLYAIRDSVLTQYGIGSSKFGHKATMPSAAAALADANKDTWSGFFPLPDGRIWYTRGIGDAILPEDDQVFDSVGEAKAHAKALIEGAEQGKLYAPESWKLEDEHGIEVDTRPLAQVIRFTASTARMRPVSAFQDVSPKLGILLVSLILGFLSFSYFFVQYIEMQAAQQRAAIVSSWPPAAKFLPKSPQQAAQRPEQIKPWINAYPFLGAVQACLATLKNGMITLPGYEADQIGCNAQKMNISYKRVGRGNPAWIETYAQNLKLPVSIGIDYQNQRVAVSEPFTGLRARGPQALWTRNSVYHNLSSLLMIYSVGGTFNMTPVPPPPPPADPKEAEKLPPPPPPAVRFEGRFGLPLEQIAAIVDHIPGSMLESIEFDPSSRQWSLKGITYHED